MLEIYFESYGCSASHNSTEIMKGLVKQAGLNITSNLDFADLIVINSCIVKQPTHEKIRRRVQDLLDKKKKVILAGCMPKFIDKSLKNKIGISLFLIGVNHSRNIVSLIREIVNDSYSLGKYLDNKNEIKLNLPKIPRDKFIGITQISEGCLGNCSYCIVKLAKGKLFSYPEQQIIKSIKNDIGSGCKEIWLTSQDNANYGNEQGKYLLPDLLKEITNIKGNFFVRIGMMNPDNLLKILPELIEIYRDKKIFKFLHVPIQSGSDKILKAMKRHYTKKQVLKIINEFRKQIPGITISTDIIVGFPTETEKDFQETMDLIKEIRPEILNISKFHPRPNTYAEKMKQISSTIKIERAKKLSELHLSICNEIQKHWINKDVRVIVDKKNSLYPGTYLARDENYKLFVVLSKEKILGKILNVRVKKIMPHYLIGEVV